MPTLQQKDTSSYVAIVILSAAGPPDFTVGYGLLFSPRSISGEVVSEALAKLDADPDSKTPLRMAADQRTLARGWFHAADDSANFTAIFARPFENT